MIEFVLHLDVHLRDLLVTLGPWVYVIFFAVIFCETGLVVTPFLPGDSLLFALGAVAATQAENLSIVHLAVILPMAAISGDQCNYLAGRLIGPKVFRKDSGWFLNRKHLVSTEEFYERHGGKTIFLAKFLPIFRTFAPFVAGIGKMPYPRFLVCNISSGLFWTGSLLFAGYFFGNIPIVKQNFEKVILGIIGLSLMPLALKIVKASLTKETNHPPDTAKFTNNN